MRHQASLHRVPFNVVLNLQELSVATHKPIKVLFLPERLADTAQQFLGPTGGRSLGPVHQLRELDVGRPKYVYVIGHNDICIQGTETLGHERLQMISYDPGDLVLPQVDRSYSSGVQQPIQCDKGRTAGEMFRQEGAFLRQASPEPPSDKHWGIGDVPVRQTTTIGVHDTN